MKLLIDDLRDIPGVDLIARSYSVGVDCLRCLQFDTLYLDHDLGDETRCGSDVVRWMAEVYPKVWWPETVVLVTDNPAGRLGMKVQLERMGYQGNGVTFKIRQKVDAV
jgi:hypothetical protein